jgi:glycosyltransferase involved in cell wall biosynthesis
MKKSIKKLIIVFENLEYGGMTTFIENLVNSKSFKYFDILLITNKTNKGILSLKKNIRNKRFTLRTYSSLNATDISFVTASFFYKIVKIFNFILRPILFLISILQFYLILKKKKPDIILAACGGYGNFRSDSASLISAKILNIPQRILSIHHCYFKTRFWSFFISFMDIFISESATSIIFGSKAVKTDIKKNTFLLNKIKTSEVIHHGVSLKKVRRKNYLKKIFKTNNNKILKIGLLSRIESEKGHYDLIKVFNLLPLNLKKKIKVFFIGPAKKEELIKVNDQLKFYNLKNYFKVTGFIKANSLEIFKNLDLVLSLSRTFEGFGLSIAEALVAKKPVLVTRVGAVTEFLNNKNSKLINPNKKSELLSSLKDFIKNNKNWNLKAINGHRDIMKNFTSEITAKKYFNHFNF